jgi:Fe(3+) dicitrate transport protein
MISSRLHLQDRRLFKAKQFSIAIGLSMSCLTYAQAEELTEATSNNVLPTIKLEAQGNWLEDANAEKVQKHAGARTIINRNRLD